MNAIDHHMFELQAEICKTMADANPSDDIARTTQRRDVSGSAGRQIGTPAKQCLKTSGSYAGKRHSPQPQGRHLHFLPFGQPQDCGCLRHRTRRT